jgi:hypothetical protein
MSINPISQGPHYVSSVQKDNLGTADQNEAQQMNFVLNLLFQIASFMNQPNMVKEIEAFKRSVFQ